MSENTTWTTWKEGIIELTLPYFAMDRETIEAYLEKNFFNLPEKCSRLNALLSAILPYCEEYERTGGETDPAIKKKVGQVFLSKLDYSQLDFETDRDSYQRVGRLFQQITNKGINPYKTIYCQVISSGSLKRDKDTYKMYYDKSRDFDSIYKALSRALTIGENDSEVAARVNSVIEQCSTLISKANTRNIYNVLDVVKTFPVFGKYRCFFLLRSEEIVNLFSINPTLFCTSSETINSAYPYLARKVDVLIGRDSEKYRIMGMEEDLELTQRKMQILRSWLKNNSTLLTMKAASMEVKENYIKKALGQTYSGLYRDFFCNPVNLNQINQMQEKRIISYAAESVKVLEQHFSREVVESYLRNNILVFAMNPNQLSRLIENVKDIDRRNPEMNYVTKFLTMGKSLFGGNPDFSSNIIITKLKDSNVTIPFDVSKMSGQECLNKFIDLFFPKNSDVARKINQLILEKNDRNEKGEKKLRQQIRETGELIKELSPLLKLSFLSYADKANKVCSLASDISQITDLRFRLAGKADIEETKAVEREISEDIETTLNVLRDTFAKKQGKVQEKFDNVEELYEKTMQYLDECFDDKKPLPVLFKEEVVLPYLQTLKDSFEMSQNEQLTFFGESLAVSVPDQELARKMKVLNKRISDADHDAEEVSVEIRFEK